MVSMDELPHEIIQHIQSFLKTREAARTIILSKSWLRAWSTRPFLDFVTKDFSHQNSDDALINLIDTTLRSYVEQGLTILKLRLRRHTIHERWLQLVRQCNVIQLALFSYQKWEPTFWPLIFMTKSLQSLKVDTSPCKLVRRPDCELVLSHTDIERRNLNILDLTWVDIDYVTFLTIMSVCPLIEKLLLHGCILGNRSNSGGFVGGEFASLKTLSLIKTEINDEQFQTILSKSPRLEDLNLIIDWYKLSKPINLSSVSLQRVNIQNKLAEVVIIDAPNLHRLKYTVNGCHTTLFPITTAATKGEINVKFNYQDHKKEIDSSWFHGLREFLSKFAKSKVKFNFDYNCPLRCYFEELGPLMPLPHRHQVEFLKFRAWFLRLPLLYSFFTICHPKIVLLSRLDARSNRESLTKLLKDLTYRGNLECCKVGQNKCWRHYIKDAKVYYEVDKEQKPLDMNELETWLSGNWELIILALEWESSD